MRAKRVRMRGCQSYFQLSTFEVRFGLVMLFYLVQLPHEVDVGEVVPVGVVDDGGVLGV